MFNNHICDPLKCNLLNSRYQNCFNINVINENYKLMCLMDVISTIHCHICHSYDIGSRLTKYERKQIDDTKHDHHNEFESKLNEVTDGSYPINQKLIKLISFLNDKQLKCQKIANNTIRTRSNKFSSNLYQTTTFTNKKKNLLQYSYSFPFVYKKQFQHLQTMYYGWKVCELYVPSKHETLKDELVSNLIHCITLQSWNIVVSKAKYLKNTLNARKSYAKTHTYYPKAQHSFSHPIHFGYTDGSEITLNHLIVLRIYCEMDKLQSKFTETYRKINSQQTMQDIIRIHANFHHFAKYLKECIEVFGTEYKDGVVKRMYHGIDKEMTFDSTTADIFGPLSTTYNWTVGVQFSQSMGLVLELVPYPALKYFQCDWVSPFSAEGELLFIAGYGSMYFVNITNAFGYQYDKYINALRIIETLSNGQYFMADPSDTHKIMKSNPNPDEVKLLKLKNITVFDKKLCLALIFHELYRNGYKNDKYSQIGKL
eukprot:130890_1